MSTMPEFTAQAIRLPDGSTTLDLPSMFDQSPRFLAVERLTRLLIGDPKGKRIADLGCFEGGFAVGLAAMGAEVLGIEARDTNMAKLRFLEQTFKDELEVRFAQSDAKDFTVDRHGRFDLVLCLGLLYHLDAPVAWLSQAAATTDAIIVDTAYAPDAFNLPGNRFEAKLGPLVEHEGYEGRWYDDLNEAGDREAQLTASWSNAQSFWLTKRALRGTLLGVGFRSVVEYTNRASFAAEVEDPRTRVVVAAWR